MISRAHGQNDPQASACVASEDVYDGHVVVHGDHRVLGSEKQVGNLRISRKDEKNKTKMLQHENEPLEYEHDHAELTSMGFPTWLEMKLSPLLQNLA